MPRNDHHRRSPRFTLLILVMLSITVITLDANDVPVLSGARNVGQTLLSPVGNFLYTITSPVRSLTGDLGDGDRLRKENEELRARVDELQGRVIANENAAENLRRLQEQLNIEYVGGLETETARVVAGPISNFEDFTVRIDKGADRGLAVGMPVVTKAGLVGRIRRVDPTSSVVQLLADPSFVVGIRVARTQDLGVGHGGGAERPFIVDRGIELRDPVQEGDAVVSSGLSDAALPPGIPVGTVSKVTPQEADRTQVLDVQPAADLTRLDIVQVVRWTPPN